VTELPSDKKLRYFLATVMRGRVNGITKMIKITGDDISDIINSIDNEWDIIWMQEVTEMEYNRIKNR
jgi:hypothetical protein